MKAKNVHVNCLINKFKIAQCRDKSVKNALLPNILDLTVYKHI
uniref:Uncharacterized protein n=1 Tax=Anguilla anguilla TaxID=7936 RepID=A0A0E9Q1M7_ANGAN